MTTWITYNVGLMHGAVNLLVMDVGNSRTQVGRVLGTDLDSTASYANEAAPEIVAGIVERWATLPTDAPVRCCSLRSMTRWPNASPR